MQCTRDGVFFFFFPREFAARSNCLLRNVMNIGFATEGRRKFRGRRAFGTRRGAIFDERLPMKKVVPPPYKRENRHATV